MSESLQLRGTLRGHNGWVTQIAINPKYPDMIISSSRGELSMPKLYATYLFLLTLLKSFLYE